MPRYELARTNEEVDDVINACLEAQDAGTSKFSGMTYEEGVRSALDWAIGHDETNPLED